MKDTKLTDFYVYRRKPRKKMENLCVIKSCEKKVYARTTYCRDCLDAVRRLSRFEMAPLKSLPNKNASQYWFCCRK